MSNKPTHTAYTVREGKGDAKPYWLAIGAVWPIKDGFKIKLDAMPFDGEIVIRKRSEKAENGGQQ